MNNMNVNDVCYWEEKVKCKANELSSPKYNVIIEKNIPVVMADGIRLYCDIYRPDTDEKNKFPALVGFSPFGKEIQEVGRRRDPIRLGKFMYEQSIEVGGIDFFASRGYNVIVPNPRGISNSEGDWCGLLSEQDQLEDRKSGV